MLTCHGERYPLAENRANLVGGDAVVNAGILPPGVVYTVKVFGSEIIREWLSIFEPPVFRLRITCAKQTRPIFFFSTIHLFRNV